MNRAIENKLARILGEVHASVTLWPESGAAAVEQVARRIAGEILGPLGYDEVSFREAWTDQSHRDKVFYAHEADAAETYGAAI